MLTLLLTAFALFAFALGYYIGKLSVLKETTEHYEGFKEKMKPRKK